MRSILLITGTAKLHVDNGSDAVQEVGKCKGGCFTEFVH